MVARTLNESSTPPSSTPTNGLRRELKVVDAAAFSAGTIGPVGSMALLGVGAAALLGSGVTWAFVFAIIGVSLVAYGFIRLSRYISNVGSVYALVGRTLGPRAGFVAGAALLIAYATICAGATMEIAIFLDKFFVGIHVLSSASEYIWVATAAVVVAVALSLTHVKVVTRTLLYIELSGILVVSVLSIVILVRLGIGHAPQGRSLNWRFLKLPHGTGIGTIAGAAVFGFLAFAGFEGAAALGEETVNPKREIPRAIKIAVLVVGAFFLLTIVGQSLGYGTDAGGVRTFAAADSPYTDLAGAYIGHAMAVLMDLIAGLSLFSVTIGLVNGSARVGYALVRDAGVRGPLTRLSRRAEPVGMICAMGVIILCFMIGQRLAGTTVLDATFYWLTIGTISLLVAYAMVTVGAVRFLFLGHTARAPRWQIVIPILALALVIYTIYKNVVGVAGPYRAFPYIVLALLVLAAVIVFAVPGLAGRVRARIADDSGEQLP